MLRGGISVACGRTACREKQVLFSLKQKTDSSAASYDRQSLEPLVIVERNLESGLVWQVRTTVRRLTPEGRAVAIRVRFLPGKTSFLRT